MSVKECVELELVGETEVLAENMLRAPIYPLRIKHNDLAVP
jgi:hypothetical protein